MNPAIGNNLSTLRTGLQNPSANVGSKGAPGQFADTLQGYLKEVNQLQSDASKSVQGLVTGQSDDLSGVMSAMEKSDVAFKTLLAIRAKLMDAYEEIKNMPI